MGNYKNRQYTLRIDEDLMTKMRIIAERESRSLNMQLEKVAKEHIERYEKENGMIK